MPKKICKVLVVEDNRWIQELLEGVFVDEGYHFVLTDSGDEMRRVLAVDPGIDVVVIDVRLPGGSDGFALAQEVAQRGLGVILVTGDHSHCERLEASGHRYILKPFRIATLLDVLAETLRETQRRCQRALPRPNAA